MGKSKKVAIIGAGAAGCFCSIELARRNPDFEITVFEAAKEPMRKLSLTGGGRCNITNTFEGVTRYDLVYPRGERLMKRLLHEFTPRQTREWFSAIGVPTYAQDDCRVFPKSNDALQVVSAFRSQMSREGVKLLCDTKVETISNAEGKFIINTSKGEYTADRVVVTSGGGEVSPLKTMEIPIMPPLPSLFSFKIPVPELTALMGCSVENVNLSIAGTNFKSSGALLVSDWGVSGPAVLKLSSYAARSLAATCYSGDLLINWKGENEEKVRVELQEISLRNPRKMLANVAPDGLSERIWRLVIYRAGIREDMRWAELGRSGINKLTSVLSCDVYPIRGRARFKEEFVTSGGVALNAISPHTLESKTVHGLYFAGEILDIDAITGGFNLQAAWSTAYKVASKLQ